MFPWEMQALVGLFCDPYLADVDVEGVSFEHSLLQVADWLKELAGAEEEGSTYEALEEAALLFQEAAQRTSQGRASFKQAARISEWCTELQMRLQGLALGEMLVVPGGWNPSDKKKDMQTVIYIFHRTSEAEFALSICNAGAGVNFHALDCTAYPKERRAKSWRLLGAARAQVTDFFWLNALFSAYFTKDKLHSPELIYEVLLPFVLPGGDLREASDEYVPSTPQCAGISSYKCIPPALRLILQARGVGKVDQKRLMCKLRLQQLSKIKDALTQHGLPALDRSDVLVIDCACRQVARKVLREEQSEQLSEARELLREIEVRLAKTRARVRQAAAAVGRSLCCGAPADNIGLVGFPGWELLAMPWYVKENRQALRHLMGPGTRQKIPCPVDILRLESLNDGMELVLAACDVCNALERESQEAIYKLRIGALIEAVFTRQMPPGDKRWQEFAFTLEEQKKVLEALWHLFQHYITAVAACFTPRRQISAQLLTARSIHVAFEVLLHQPASDGMLPVTAALRAPEGGELGTDLWSRVSEPDLCGRAAADATQDLPLASPELAGVRDILQRHATLSCGHGGRVWDSSVQHMKLSENSLSATQELIQTLTQKVLGIPSTEQPVACPDGWPKWTWVFGWALDNHGKVALQAPEWCWWRDISMWCKYLCLDPASRRFSEKHSYQARDACISWAFGYCECDKRLTLRPESLCRSVQFKAMSPDCGKVARTGSDLEAAGMAHGAQTEDDVVHAPRLPNFSKALAQEEAEVLLSALTVPYLRIPLILHFFAADRLHALNQTSLQEILWASLFEPGVWIDDTSPPLVTSAPANSPKDLGTSRGLLQNECWRCLSATAAPLQALCQQADELANVAPPAEFEGGATEILLFIVRLAARFQAELRCRQERGVEEQGHSVAEDLQPFLESNARRHLLRWLDAASQDVGACVKLHAHLVLTCAFSDLSVPEHLTMLTGSSAYVTAWYAQGMEQKMGAELQVVFEILQRRRLDIVEALQSSNSVERKRVLDTVSHVVSNFVTGDASWEGGVEPKPAEEPKQDAKEETTMSPELLIPNWPSHATKILENLTARFSDKFSQSEIISAIVEGDFHGGNAAHVLQKLQNCDTKMPAALKPAPGPGAQQTLMDVKGPGIWRCPLSNGGAAYDAQSMVLWLESGLLRPIPVGIKRIPDFDQCFGQRAALMPTSRPLLLASRCHVFAVQDNEGATFELQWWSACVRGLPEVQATDVARQIYKETVVGKGVMALGLPSFEDGDTKKVSGVCRAKFERGDIEKWLRCDVGRKDLVAVWEQLVASATTPGNEEEKVALTHLLGDNWFVQKGRFNDQTLEVSAIKQVPTKDRRNMTWLELRFACQGQPVVRGFSIGEFGRHVYRQQVFASAGEFSYAEFEPNTKGRPKPSPSTKILGTLVTHDCHESLVVTDGGRRVWVSPLALRGLLPDVLLENYCFWMHATSSASVMYVGEPLSPLVHASLSYTIEVVVDSKGVACVTRSGTSQETWLLASPLHAPEGSQIALFMTMLAPLESASHVLFWVKVDPEALSALPKAADLAHGAQHSSFDAEAPDALSVDALASCDFKCPSGGLALALVELPRLQMKFETGADPLGGLRLFSKEFNSFYVIDRRACLSTSEWEDILGDPRGTELEALLSCMPHAVVLRNTAGALRILASNADLYRPDIESKPFTTELLVDRACLPSLGQRHFVWEVHESASLLLSSSLSGTLCLCLLLLLHREYLKCARYMQSISFDEEISKDELRLLKMNFLSTKSDTHPDAHALRLKLTLALAQHNPKHEWLKPLTKKDYHSYVAKVSHVSRPCRLLFREESILLQILADEQNKLDRRMQTRMSFVDAVLGHGIIDKTALRDAVIDIEWEIAHPARSHQHTFAFAEFKQWLERPWAGWRENAKVSELEQGKAREEFTELVDLSRRCDNEDWAGAHGSMFTTMYAILTGESCLRLEGHDVSIGFARLALQKLWLRTRRQEGKVCKILWAVLAMRVLGKQEELPTWKELLDVQKCLCWGYVPLWQEEGQEWLKQLHSIIKDSLEEISSSGLFRQPAMCVKSVSSKRSVTIPKDLLQADLLHLIPRPPPSLEDFSCASASLGDLEDEFLQILSLPFEGIAADAVTNFSLATQVPPNVFTLEKLKALPGGMTQVASDIASRLESGHATFMARSLERRAFTLSSFAKNAELTPDGLAEALKSVVELEAAVREVWSADLVAVQSSRNMLLNRANDVPDDEAGFKFCLRRSAGLETYIWLEWCIGAVLDGERGFEGSLREVNSVSTASVGSEVLKLMLQTSRVSQAQHVLAALQDLHAAAERCRDAGLNREELGALSERAAQFLAAARSYTARHEMQVEPAFLFFEYVTGFLIRKPQVALIRRLARTAVAGDSLVAQMIMGAGKTTCIAPMLTLLLGNRGRLVLNVVPKNLLSQTREVMRKIFGQILAKRVVTLDFSRGTGQQDPFEVTLVRNRLFEAQRDAAVVCTTPAAIKSMFLRHLELLEINALHNAQKLADEKAMPRADYVSRQRLGRRIQNLSQQMLMNRAMAGSLGQVIAMLRNNSCALVDEVDLVLHPLKSELNFPIGDMEMYDLGSDRWHLAVHLLDALYLCVDGHAAASSFYPWIREGELDSEAEEAEENAVIQAVSQAEAEAKAEAEAAQAAAAAAKAAEAKAKKAEAMARSYHAASTVRRPRSKAKAKAKSKSRPRKAEPELAVEEPVAEEVTSQDPTPAPLAVLEIKKRGKEIVADVAAHISQLEVKIPQVLQEGFNSLALQRQPHLVILSASFYHNNLRRLLAEWLACWILTRDDAAPLWSLGLGLEEVSSFLAQDLEQLLASKLHQRMERAAGPQVGKLLALGREWLFSLLPYLLSKVNRVHYGLLTEAELESASNQMAPSSRRLLAVPFVGKDKPSPAAEFAQPDVLIGFTVLAYRYEGLRASDIMQMLHHLQQKAGRESGPWTARPTCVLFEWWKELGRKHLLAKGPQSSEDLLCWEVEVDRSWEPLRHAVNERLRHALAKKQAVVKFRTQDGMSYEIDLERMVQRDLYTKMERRVRQTLAGADDLRLPELQALAVSGEDAEKTEAMKKEQQKKEAEKQKREQSLEEDTKQEDIASPQGPSHAQPGHVVAGVKLLGSVPEIVIWYLLEMIFDAVLRQQPHKISATGQEIGSSMLFSSRIGFSGTPSSLLPEELGECLFEAENEGEILSVLSDERHIAPPLIEMPTDWTPNSILDRIATSESPRFHALIDTGALVMGLTNEEVAKLLLQKLPKHTFDGVVFFDDRDAPMMIKRNAMCSVLLAEAGVPMHRRFTFFDQVHTTGTDTKQPLQSFAALTISASMTFRDYAQGAWRMRGLGKGQKLQLLLTPELVKKVQHIVHDPDLILAPELVLNDVVAFLLSNGFESEGRQAVALKMQNLATVWRRRALDNLMKCKETEREGAHKEVEAFKESLRFPVDVKVMKPPGLPDKMRDALLQHKELMSKEEIDKCNSLIEAASAESDGRGSDDLGVEITRQQEKEQEKQQEKEKEVEAQVGRERDAEVPWPLECLVESALPDAVFYTLSQFRMSGLPSGSELTCSASSLISSNHTVNDLLSLSARRLKNVIVLFVLPHPSGKRTIAVSLAEAAALRRASHLCVAELPCDCALWLCADSQKVPESSHLLMGSSGKRSDAGSGLLQARRLDAARQMLRFFNCDLDFKPEEITVSVRTLDAGGVQPPQRRNFIDCILRARRREACAWQDTALGEIVRGDMAKLEWAQALVVRLHGCLTRVLHLRTANEVFQVFDVDGRGVILFDTFQKELNIKFPGEFSATEIRELFQQADAADSGHITIQDMEELFRYGCVAGGSPEPARASPSFGRSREAFDSTEGSQGEHDGGYVESGKIKGHGTEHIFTRDADSSVLPNDETRKEHVEELAHAISAEEGAVLMVELSAQIEELFAQRKSLIGELSGAAQQRDHNKFMESLHMLAVLGANEVPGVSGVMSRVVEQGAGKTLRRDKLAFHLAVLARLSGDSALQEELERQYAQESVQLGRTTSLTTATANVEKNMVEVCDTWEAFQQSWSQLVGLPVESAESIPELKRYASAFPKNLLVQLFVLERLYRIGPAAVFDVAFDIAIETCYLALTRREEASQLADKAILWALLLLVQLVKESPEESKKPLSKPEFLEVANQMWNKFQSEFRLISALCFVLDVVPVQLTRWQVLEADSWQDLDATQALELRRGMACGKSMIYFSVDEVPHCIDLAGLEEVNLETKSKRKIRELAFDIYERTATG